MAQTEGKGGRGIEEAQGKTGQAQGDQGWTRKEIKSTKEGIKRLSNCKLWQTDNVFPEIMSPLNNVAPRRVAPFFKKLVHKKGTLFKFFHFWNC